MNVAIVLNGQPTALGVVRRVCQESDLVLCADGGISILSQAGVRPHILLGDMDSADQALLKIWETEGGALDRHNPHKDETDGQLAVDLAIARKADRVTLLCALGGRPDHAYGNLMLLRRLADAGIPASIEEDGLCIQAVRGSCVLHGKPGQTLSVLPIGDDLVIASLTGVEYPLLTRTPMPLGLPLGVSNVLSQERAELRLESGVALVFHFFS
jgi:thiamine pyrophosphokinase